MRGNEANVTQHALSIAAAREAGALIMQYFGANYATWDKGKNNPVTEVDLAVDRLLQRRLLGATPDYGWLSEETVDDQSRKRARRVWVVDPIDGTRAFIRGQPHFAISIALLEDNKPVSAVIFNPATDELFDATLGGQARRNGTPIQVSSQSDLPGARMLASSGVFQHRRWKSPWPDMHVESRNSIAYQVALTAAGIFDGCLLLSGAHDWDLAAADLIIRAAGGRITDHDGADFNFNRDQTRQQNMVAAGPALHTQLLRRIKA